MGLAARRSGRLRVGHDIVVDAVHQGVLEALFDRRLAPGEVLLLRFDALAVVASGGLQQPVRGVCPSIEDDVLAQVSKRRLDVVVDGDLPGIDDGHVEAGGDGMVEKHRVHRLAHGLVAAKGKGQVGHATRNVRVRQLGLDLARRLDEGEPVAVVLLDTGGDREDVGIENDVLGGKPSRPVSRP